MSDGEKQWRHLFAAMIRVSDFGESEIGRLNLFRISIRANAQSVVQVH